MYRSSSEFNSLNTTTFVRYWMSWIVQENVARVFRSFYCVCQWVKRLTIKYFIGMEDVRYYQRITSVGKFNVSEGNGPGGGARL